MAEETAPKKPRRRWNIEPFILAIIIIAGYFCALTFVLTQPIPQASERIIDMMLGTLTAAFLLVLNYFYTTNASADRKTELIAKAGPVETH